MAPSLGLAIQMNAATFSVTPDAISSTHAGPVNLEIGGLTNMEPVVLRHYLDLNANGLAEPEDLLMERFRLTDGQAPVIGGVTNFAVPGDRNTATGAITAVLNYGITLDNIVGQHLFLLSSPVGNFAPISVPFIVTNPPLSQSVAGRVYAGSSPVPHAVVVALAFPDYYLRGAAVADANGEYFLNLNRGAYALLPALPGYYADQAAAVQVTLTNGITATNRLYLTNGAATLSGTITNLGNGTTLPGLMVMAESGNLLAIASTDTNGVYTAGVNASFWKVNVEGDRLSRRGFVAWQQGPQFDVTTGSVAGASFGLPPGNALIYGRITVSSNAPLTIVSLSANDQPHVYEARGFSGTNGGFQLPVLAGTNAWHCNLSGSHTDILSNAVVAASAENLVLATNQALQIHFNVLPATAIVSGRLLDSSGNPVSGVDVSAYAELGGMRYFTRNSATDSAGNFGLPVVEGAWTLSPNCCGSDGLEGRGLVDLFSHTVVVPPTNTAVTLVVYPIGTPAIFQPVRLPPAGFSFMLHGASNASYTVQVSTNLAGTNWQDLYTLELQGRQQLITDPQASNSARYYRIRKN